MVDLLRKCHSCDRFPVTLREVNTDFNDYSEVDEITSAEDFDDEFSGDESDDESDKQN